MRVTAVALLSRTDPGPQKAISVHGMNGGYSLLNSLLQGVQYFLFCYLVVDALFKKEREAAHRTPL